MRSSNVRRNKNEMKEHHLIQLKDIFSQFDLDRDGSLTHLELAALLRSLGLKPAGDQMHALLRNMDANGNGFVEFDEFADAIVPMMSDQAIVNQEQLLGVFRAFDRDGNGYISAAELARSMAQGHDEAGRHRRRRRHQLRRVCGCDGPVRHRVSWPLRSAAAFR